MKRQWALIKQRISKGDLCFEETLEVFDDETKARTALADRQKSASGGYPDWDEYTLRELTP